MAPQSEDNILYVPGSSEVKSVRISNTSSTTTVRAVTPGPGLVLRVISVEMVHAGATSNGLEVYFGTGANIGTNAGSEITERRAAAIGSDFRSWPERGGPVGGPGEPISTRGTASVAEAVTCIIHYREEPFRAGGLL